MVGLAQLVRASDCGSEGHGFEPHIPPQARFAVASLAFFIFLREKGVKREKDSHLGTLFPYRAKNVGGR